VDKQKLIKKVENRSDVFRERAVKGYGDRKRHDRVQSDEEKWMGTAHNQLGWSLAKIGSAFDRDPRTVKKYLQERQRILAQAAKYEHEIENHFAELSVTALTLASNFESYLDNGTGSGSTIGDVVYGGWLNDIDGILDALSVEMHEVDKSVALHLLCHLKEEFPELTDIKDWAELNNDKITKDFVERLRLRAYRGDFGKCPAYPNC